MHLVVSAVTTMMVSTLHSMLYQLLLLLLSNRLRVMVSTPIVDRRSELLLRLTTATPPITIDSWHFWCTSMIVINHCLLPYWGSQLPSRTSARRHWWRLVQASRCCRCRSWGAYNLSLQRRCRILLQSRCCHYLLHYGLLQLLLLRMSSLGHHPYSPTSERGLWWLLLLLDCMLLFGSNFTDCISTYTISWSYLP